MFSHIHTTHWDFDPKYSTGELTYFRNRVDNSIVAEMKATCGFEYYLCSDIQMKNKTVGNYIGCVESDAKTGREANIMVYDHNTQTDKTISLDDEKFL